MSFIGQLIGGVGGFLIGGPQGAMLGASLGAGFDSYQGAREMNAQQVALSREQMEFQERMSSTAYQRAVKDMQAAGLNPMLAYSQGGASAPLGSMPQVQNASAAGAASAQAAMQTMNGITSAALQAANAELATSQAAKVRSETLEQSLHTAKLVSEIDLAKQDYSLRSAQTKTEGSRKLLVDAQEAEALAGAALKQRQEAIAQVEETLRGDTFSADVARRKAESAIAVSEVPRAKSEAEFWEKMGQANPYIRLMLEVLRGVSPRGLAVGR